MKKLRKILILLIASIVVLISVFLIIFYTPDISLSDLMDRYYGEQSQMISVQIVSSSDVTLDLDIHVQDHGNQENPVVVLLHGLFASSHTFLPWIERLVEENYRVISIDLPGFGLSTPFPDGKTSTKRQSEVVFEVIEYLEIDELFIGGNSMGGGVSWYFSSQYHQRDVTILGIILIDAVFPTPMDNSSSEASFLFNVLASPLGPVLSRLTPKFLFQTILNGVYGSASTLEEEALTRYFELLRYPNRRPQFITQVRLEEITSMTNEERLLFIKDANIPVLVLWGEEDSWISKDVTILFQNAFDLSVERVIIFTGLGHVPMEENPDLTIVPVIAFLNEFRNED
ncbi:MAG: alpha/beta hydrolase [Candidatus Izemoplasmatales bacterium]|nr:alpha/beta hydrolase [bacterium]MDZ4196463.1 alpha/beta hydrolase [Candidatus Izemoplasmatales bacterium]